MLVVSIAKADMRLVFTVSVCLLQEHEAGLNMRHTWR